MPLAGEFGFGGTIFFIFGYTLKKVFKILAMIFVFSFGLFGLGLGLLYANQKGWVNIQVNWAQVEAGSEYFATAGSFLHWFSNGILSGPEEGLRILRNSRIVRSELLLVSILLFLALPFVNASTLSGRSVC